MKKGLVLVFLLTALPTVVFCQNSLSGAGSVAGGSLMPPPGHSVSLTWAASTSSGVIGYNIYRSQTNGGPYTLLNSALISGTVYTDTVVVAGQTYYYVATAVGQGNAESVYSNQASATVPTP
jgi:hypothetical protein